MDRALLWLGAIVMSLISMHPPAYAHDLGVLTVDAQLQAGRRYDLTISTDVDHLAAAGLGLSDAVKTARAVSPASSRAFELVGAELAKVLAPKTWVLIDGVESPLPMLIDVLVQMPGEPGMGEQAAPKLILHYSGTAPLSAQKWGFKTDLPIGQYLIRVVQDGDPEPSAQWGEAGKASIPVAFEAPKRGETPATSPENENQGKRPESERAFRSVAAEYLVLGFTHIVPSGLDHVLFVLGLFLAAVTVRTLLLQITAFTVAHCITLALGVTGVVKVSPSVVEPLIAVSIVAVAVENLFARRVTTAANGRRVEWIGPRWVWRTALVFVFGLLHGLGFAGVLGEIGLPKGQLVPALLSFNVGVEAGQLAVVAAAMATIGLLRGRPWYRAAIVVPGSLGIAAVGVFWVIERV
ncbi:MAG: HupE/UreJ family protein [Phycisphaerales bacterium]|nr:HupE/UreJ family protein [Phycisphaerales bacterium]